MARLTPEQLEARIHNLLREQPVRRAPISLEARVLGEIARRQALPWWHQSFSRWPVPVRLAFVALSLAAVVAALLVSMQVAGVLQAGTLTALFQPIVQGVETLRRAFGALGELGRSLVPGVSMQWIYIALAVLGAAYATVIGLGATAYRLLWQQR